MLLTRERAASEHLAPKQEIVIDVQEEDAFLRALEERLQQEIDALDRVFLVLGARQINYLAFRLHEALEPKRDPETQVIQAWTIQPQSQLKVKLTSHIQVLKLSTILREVQCLQVHQQSQLRSAIELEIFPSLRAIEIVRTDATSLQSVHFFARQLRHLHIEHTAMKSLRQILSPASAESDELERWRRLETLHINCCSLPAIDKCVNTLETIRDLDLGWNEIAELQVPMISTTIESLSLRHNKLQQFPPIASLQTLVRLDLSMNQIKSLRGVEQLAALVELDLSQNLLDEINEVELLVQLKALETLCLKENPISRRPDHRREVLFYLGERITLDDAAWTVAELQSMTASRQTQELDEGMATTWAERVASASDAADWGNTKVSIGYPLLPRLTSAIKPHIAEIIAPPRRYSPQRWRAQLGMPSLSQNQLSSTQVNGMAESIESTTTVVTDDVDVEVEGSVGVVQTVDEFFRLQDVQVSLHHHTPSSPIDPIGILVDDDSSDASASESGRRSRKYTESDFMRDFEEEETLFLEGALSPTDVRATQMTSGSKSRSKQMPLNVRVLLSAEDASVYDIVFGIDGIPATLDIKSHDVVETLHVPDRESAIAFSRRLPDVVAVGTSTQSNRSKIILLKLRKQDSKTFGHVTYQVEQMSTFGRVLGPLISHLYATQQNSTLCCACSNCGGICHFTPEFTGSLTSTDVFPVEGMYLHSCLLCTSYNVREITSDRMLSIYAAEGISLSRRVNASSALHHWRSEEGFTVEEQEVDAEAAEEMYDCVFISSCGIREALVAPVIPVVSDDS
ncbi:hypothetical protein Poli38472_005687 [Pythium oligandrum]|uniref:Uncharacterized protein n=1 Tax=Pythium oligandrum TaxID=41045 RepID=A0A8K1CGF6_PYTOL|nr:hypothetical protein Poli38472_005687 [Pythium oligandrum]|eukprot:TMW63069.1 hypothetical protein Poli38472_005687 [Pythium oligandrum]